MGTTRNTNSEDPISTVSEQVDHKESRSKTIPPNRAVKQSSFDRENEATNQQLKVRDQKRKEKRQRRKKIKTATSFQDPTMASVIRGLEDDLHSVDGENEPISRVPTPVTPSNFPASNLVGKVYQQRGSGFTRTHPVKLGQSTATLATTSSAKGLSATEQTPLDFGLDFQKMFRSIGVFSHGFLAGLGFWQLVTVYVLSGEDISVLDFIDLYAPLAQPFHFTFYFLTVICMLSILDRYDIAQITWSQLQQLFTLKSGGIAIFVYASTLIITLTNVTLDDRLSLHRVNVTYLESLEYKPINGVRFFRSTSPLSPRGTFSIFAVAWAQSSGGFWLPCDLPLICCTNICGHYRSSENFPNRELKHRLSQCRTSLSSTTLNEMVQS
ncbi:hypothetical protein TCAL_06988, partial [Tigriopus californicus]